MSPQSVDGLHANGPGSRRQDAVTRGLSAASVRSCSLKRCFGWVKRSWRCVGNNPHGLNLKNRRHLVGALGCDVGLGVGASVHALQPKLENTPPNNLSETSRKCAALFFVLPGPSTT